MAIKQIQQVKKCKMIKQACSANRQLRVRFEIIALRMKTKTAACGKCKVKNGILIKPVKKPRVANPRESKPRDERISCNIKNH